LVKMAGPKGFVHYKGYGDYVIKSVPYKKTKIGFIAGGTGITPCF